MALNKKNFSNIKYSEVSYSEVNIRCFLSARIREVFTLHNLAQRLTMRRNFRE
jgi:hypothetical protein